MTDWDKYTTRILKAVTEVKPTNQHEEVIQMAILLYLYKSFKDEKTFNDNCELLRSIEMREKMTR